MSARQDVALSWYFRELFNGLKAKLGARLFTLFFLVIRILFICIVIPCQSWNIVIKTSLFTSVQFLFTIYLLAVRPMFSTKDNLIECFNQIVYLLIVGMLIHFDIQSEWGPAIENVYVVLIMSGPIFGSLVSFVGLAISLYLKIKNCKRSDRAKVYQKEPAIQPVSIIGSTLGRSQSPIKSNIVS